MNPTIGRDLTAPWLLAVAAAAFALLPWYWLSGGAGWPAGPA